MKQTRLVRQQTRLISGVEVVMNVGTGFIFAMLVWKYIIPEMFPRMAGPILENIMVTTTFTVVSILRGYFWRRFFSNGFHIMLVSVASKIWHDWGEPYDAPTGDNSGKIEGGRRD